ncbi:lipase [Phycomyces blakesleeanus]|uniref:Fungal lipase-type domain-containing protein n=2 Tax=Phycomyces blakesleeanus TaxID=4837 RepID=A0A167LKP3_PHYB8|nr:hypothetical protein PHYBLDRAFT_148574 [Phycomyces blakesleeanus NRRL 1555(-)]OAD70656.1 hypothetical protein PHYBLDRAFT_148574 [Phycomyces blakesleeanus NRRL 1555(-)]|eukprot:XP_018288696.1 hypothetical protein PHYBLDRAFT_148574 [Phycomyces blakesleeanus NRRL 1555(-)]
MKFTPLSIITVAILLVSSPVSLAIPAAKNTFNNVTQPFSIPPLIAERVTMPTILPAVNLFAEKMALIANGLLPENVAQIHGLGLNSSLFDFDAAHSGISRRANVYATAAKIDELTKYAQFSANSYCPSVQASNWTCTYCYKDDILVSVFKSSKYDINGYISRNDKTKVITLVFRGSITKPNFIADIKLIQQDYPPVPGTKVHTGFYEAYMDAQKEILKAMTEQITKYPDYKTVVIGHSLGAGIAVLAGLDLFQRDSRFNAKNLSIITLGGPRVGNPYFAYYATGTGIPLERIVNKRDVIAHMPSQALNYLHFGTEYWNKSDNRIKICDDALDSPDCSNSIVPFTSFRDHFT